MKTSTKQFLLHSIFRKQKSQIFFALFAITLSACGLAPTEQTVIAPITSTPTFTPVVQTPAIFPTGTPLPPSPTPPPSFPLNNLLMAYIVDGNLYLQKGNNPTLQLTHVGEDWRPFSSQDGRSILFFRGKTPHKLFSINVDGSQEQELVTNDLLIALGLGYDKAAGIRDYSFVPNTHFLLFNTGEVDLYHPQETGPSSPNGDLLRIDLDTHQINVLLPPGKGGDFRVSPDGSMIAVQAKGHIDLINVNGRMIKRDFVTYTPTHPYDLSPNFFWNSASTELIVSLPARDIYDMSGPEAYSVWRYAIDGSSKTQLSFDPPPLDSCCASPDGNWFLYPYYYYPGKTSDEIPHGLYLGSLRNSDIQLYDPYYLSYNWSPDSVHFIYGENELFIGAINEQPKFFSDGRFLGWLDNNHFLYYSFDHGMLFIGDIWNDGIPILTNMPIRLPLQGRNSFTFIYVKDDIGR